MIRHRLLVSSLIALTLSAPLAGQTADPTAEIPAPAADRQVELDPGYLIVRDLMSQDRKTRRTAASELRARGDSSLAFGIVDSLFFIPVAMRKEAIGVLEKLTGEKPGTSYWNWVEQVGTMEDVEPALGYLEWKAALLSRIDDNYRKILYPGAPMRIRLEEVVSGGVRIEGIPSLDDPTMVTVAEAKHMDDDERIFGVDLNGEQRAYPLRILDWHEMLNDTVGGEPVSLSYCTLCGSGVLYATRTRDGVFRFGTSGLLYRSNKLMYDRQTLTLWSNLTGEPVIGRLVDGKRKLRLLPHTRTTWGEWRQRHPDTLVVKIDRDLKKVASNHGFVYKPGRADAKRRGVSFPVWKKSDALERETEIYALRIGNAAKAYPLDILMKSGLINDVVGDQPVVLLADADSGAVRAYERGDAALSLDSQTGQLTAADGDSWQIEETGLIPTAADGSLHARLPGHFAFWFGWYAFFPQTEVFQGPVAQ